MQDKNKTKKQLIEEIARLRLELAGHGVAGVTPAAGLTVQDSPPSDNHDVYRVLVEHLRDGTYILDREGRVVFINDVIVERSGHSREWFMGRSYLELLRPEEREVARRNFEAVLRGESLPARELHYFTPSGEERYAEVNSAALRRDGEIIGAVGISRDLTERKRLEKRLRDEEIRYRSAIEFSNDGVVIVEGDVHTYVNRKFAEMMGYTAKEELIGKPVSQFVHPDDVDLIMRNIRRRQRGEATPERYECRAVRKDGSLLYFEGSGTSIVFNGITASMAVLRDISERKQAEEQIKHLNEELERRVEERTSQLELVNRKLQEQIDERVLVEDALRVSEARFRAIVQDQIELVCRFLPDTTLTFVNEAYCRFHAKTEQELIGRSFMPFVSSEDVAATSAGLAALRPENPSNAVEHKAIRHDGEARWQQWTRRAIFDEAGNIIEIQSVGRDITDRRRAEIRLEQSEERYRIATELSSEGVAISTLTEHLFVNQKFAEIFGYGSPEELIAAKNRYMMVHPDDRQKIRDDVLHRLRTGGGAVKYQFRGIRKDGSLIYLESSNSFVMYKGQRVSLVYLRDVTEQKKAEIYLQESEKKYRALFEASNDSLFFLKEGIITECNPRALELLGLKREEIIGRSPLDFSPPLQPDGVPSARTIRDGLREVLAGKRQSFEWRGLRGDGSLFDAEINVSAVVVGGEHMVQVVARDITHKKRAYEALAASERRYKAIVQDQIELVSRFLPDGTVSFVNDACCRYFQLEPNEIIGHSFLPLLAPEDREFVTTQIASLSRETPTVTVEERVILPGGEIRWQQWVNRGIFDERGCLVEYQGVGRDITSQKMAEEQLRYRLAIEELIGGISKRFIAVENGRIERTMNRVLEEIGRFVGADRSFMCLYREDESNAIERIYEWCNEGVRPYSQGLIGMPTDTLSWTAEAVRNRRVLLIRSIADMPQEAAAEKEFCECIGVTSYATIPISAGNTCFGYFGFGTGSSRPVCSEEDLELFGMLGEVFGSVLERKRAEEELALSEGRYRDIFENAMEGILQGTPEGRYLRVNPAYAHMHGYTSPEEMMGCVTDIGSQVYVNPADPVILWRRLEKEGFVEDFEAERLIKDGSTFWAKMSARVVRDGAGRILFAEGMVRDISDQKTTEKRITEQRDLALALMADSSLDEMLSPCLAMALRISGMDSGGLYVFDGETATFRLVCATGPGFDSCFLESVCIRLGIQSGDPVGLTGPVYLTDGGLQTDDLDDSLDMKTGALAILPLQYEAGVAGCLVAGTLSSQRISGHTRSLLEMIAAQIGSALGRIRVKENLRESEEKYRTIFENAIMGIFLSTPAGRLLGANPALAHIYHFDSPEEMINTLTDLGNQHHVDPNNRLRLAKILDEEGSVRNFESRAYTKQGEVRRVSANIKAMRGKDGTQSYWIGTVEDITRRKEAEDALRMSEEKFRMISEKSLVGVYITQRDVLKYVNPTFAHIFGFDPEEMVGRLGRKDYLHPEDLPMVEQIVMKYLTGELPSIDYEARGLRKNGEVVYVQVLGAKMLYEGEPAIIGTLLDVTARKRAEGELNRKVNDLSTLYGISQTLLGQTDVASIYRNVCILAVERFGLRMAWVGLVKPGDPKVYPVESDGLDNEYIDSILITHDGHLTGRGPAGRAIRTRHPAVTDNIEKDPNFRPWRKKALRAGYRSSAAFPLIVGSEVFGVIGMYSANEAYFTADRVQTYQSFANVAAMAISNARLFNSVSRQRDELRGMANRLAAAQETERKQLSRELHDQAGQNLTALNINLNILRKSYRADSSLIASIEDCLKLLKDLSESVRDVMGRLRPTVLDDYGLSSALRWYVVQFRRRLGIEASMREEGIKERLPSDSETALFRIAQEALNNVAKHATASKVTVTLSSNKEAVRLTIADNGIGFLAGIGSSNDEGKWGLKTMVERAEAIGGTCRIQSQPGSGTMVVVEVMR